MANERRKPSRRQEPGNEPRDEWDDLLGDGDLDDLEETLEDSDPADPAEPAAADKPLSRPMGKAAKQDVPAGEGRVRRRRPAAREQAPVTKRETPVQREEPPARRDEPAKRRAPAERHAAPRTEAPAQRKAPAEREAPSDVAEESFRPEDMEGAELTDDGLIRVKDGAEKKKPLEPKKESWIKSLGAIDYIGLAASLAILVGLAGMLLSWMYGEEWGKDLDRPQPVAEVPAVGEMFRITSIDSYWRRRTDDDRAPASEIIIPELTIEVEATASEGHLSVFFQDATGKMSADPGNLKLTGGQIVVVPGEGKQVAPNRFTFTSTKGFTFEPEFRSYISMEQKHRWSIEIVETKDFGKDPKRLAFFEISKDARTKREPADGE